MLLMQLCNFNSIHAQEKKDSTEQLKEMDEIIVSGSKFAEKKKNIVQNEVARCITFCIHASLSCTDELCSWYGNSICLHAYYNNC